MIEWQTIAELSQEITVMAFDYGTQKTGIAVGQTLLQTAQPIKNIAMQDGIPNWIEVLTLVTEWKPTICIVGYPLNMDGTENDLCLRAKKFARRLKHQTNINVYMVDERLTSFEARELKRDIKQNRRGNTPAIDALSATLLLESCFEHQQGRLPSV